MRNAERFFILSLIPFTAALGVFGRAMGDLFIDAQIAQVSYLCETGDESACYKLAQWTGGDCASPRMIGGCQADSYVNEESVSVINNDRRAVHAHH